MTDDFKAGMVEAELLPCPFCGADGHVYHDGEDWISTCKGDDCDHMPCCVGNESREEAVTKWNRRAALQSAPEQDKVVVPNSMPLPSDESLLEKRMVMLDSEIDKCEAVWGMGDIDRGIQNMAAEIARLRAAKEQS